ncbi:MAG: uroporphyrinogen decarboxylase family protein [Firmicutes bacterium]|nr:uroporphyrinogen decarboxylase family protein [Bacillota bacterium]
MIIDRKKKPFSTQELLVTGMKPSPRPAFPATILLNPPISYRENAMSLFWDKKPCFAVTGSDFSGLGCSYFQKHLGRSLRDEGTKVDAFGVEWVFEPTAGGSISTAGRPRFTDVNDWKDAISMPDVNDWDWAADAAANPVDTRFAVEMTMVNGFWFERLISLMDFINAAMALVDDEQTDAIGELFEATTQLACDIVDKICQYWPSVDGFMLHDDWGSQKSPFFSDEVATELFLPHMKKLVSHIHNKGRYCGLHSCGSLEARAHVFVEAGIDTWQMQANLNDVYKLYDQIGDKMALQVTIPEFDLNDEKAAVAAARAYVDHFCQPGKPTMVIARNGLTSKVFTQELYEYSRKHYLNQ